MNTTEQNSALLVVDVQNDFCAGGALAVPNGDSVVEPLNRHIGEAIARGATVYASRDWHPAESTHFKEHGGPWPPHCVQNSPGARFHPRLRLPQTAITITKGADPKSTGYSVVDGVTPDGKPFLADVRDRGIAHLYVGGLATEYCVRYSVLGALAAGLKVTVLADSIAGIDPRDAGRALDEMRSRGAEIVETTRVTDDGTTSG